VRFELFKRSYVAMAPPPGSGVASLALVVFGGIGYRLSPNSTELPVVSTPAELPSAYTFDVRTVPTTLEQATSELSAMSCLLTLVVVLVPWAFVDMLFCWATVKTLVRCCCSRRTFRRADLQEQPDEAEAEAVRLAQQREDAAPLTAAMAELQAKLEAAQQEQKSLQDRHQQAVEERAQAEREWDQAFAVFQQEKDADRKDVDAWRAQCEAREQDLERHRSEASDLKIKLDMQVTTVEKGEREVRQHVKALEDDRERLRVELKAQELKAKARPADLTANIPTPSRSSGANDMFEKLEKAELRAQAADEEKRRADELAQQVQALASSLQVAESTNVHLEADKIRVQQRLESAESALERVEALEQSLVSGEPSQQPAAAAAAAAAAVAAAGANGDMALEGRKRLSASNSEDLQRRTRRSSAPATLPFKTKDDSTSTSADMEEEEQASVTPLRTSLDRGETGEQEQEGGHAEGEDEQEARDPDDLDKLMKERWVAEDPHAYAIFEDEDEEHEYHKCRSLFLPRVLEELRLLRKEKLNLHTMASSFLDDLEAQTKRVKGLMGVAAYFCRMSGKATDSDTAVDAVEAMLKDGIPGLGA